MYKQIFLKTGRDRCVINRHPWIFSGGLKSKYEYENGEIVEVVNQNNQIIGYGFFSPKSQISVRMFDFRSDRMDIFKSDYFKDKIRKAFYLRKNIINENVTNCYRLFHAEGDFLPGLIIDIYNDVAVMQVLIKGIERIIDVIKEALIELGFKKICIKNPDANPIEEVNIPFSYISGEKSDELIVKENSLDFIIDLANGQKTGFFLDQRDNRALVKGFSSGKTVLNAFCYTGGFSVYAAAGEAKEVVSVDISADAVNMTQRNMQYCNSPKTVNKAIKADCFEYLRNMPDNYFDLIILDPPAFVKSAHNIEKGSRGYKDINLQALKKIKPESYIFTFSCSQHISPELFQKIVFSAAADAKRNVRILKILTQGADHPVNIFHPEGEYLKGLLLFVE